MNMDTEEVHLQGYCELKRRVRKEYCKTVPIRNKWHWEPCLATGVCSAPLPPSRHPRAVVPSWQEAAAAYCVGEGRFPVYEWRDESVH